MKKNIKTFIEWASTEVLIDMAIPFLEVLLQLAF